METMIQQHELTEQDYRGERLADWPREPRGNNDLLNLTQPQIIRAIHEAFLDAGAEALDNAALIREQYRGIRPAPGYPANPDQRQKRVVRDLLDADNSTGIGLTESPAMWPAAVVSGWYFSNPESQYFAVGKIDIDQVADYARREGLSLEQAERNPAPNPGYAESPGDWRRAP
jgi:hypothetical protein